MVYLKLFETEAERTAFTENYDYVSLTEETEKVHINKFIPMEERYLTFIARSNGTFCYSNGQQTFYLFYSTDNGKTWSEPLNDITINVVTGDKVLWKGFISTTFTMPGSFSDSTAQFDIEGNIMSLFYGDGFIGQNSFQPYQICYNLFMNTDCLDASNLILPTDTTTSYNGYAFYGMFEGCSRLTKAPTLAATTLTFSCYRRMFFGCNNLNYIKMLATDISATDCLTDWVYNVAANGTFVKAASMTTLPIGESGIPNGWTIQNE